MDSQTAKVSYHKDDSSNWHGLWNGRNVNVKTYEIRLFAQLHDDDDVDDDES